MQLNPPKRSGASKSSEVVGSYASVLKGFARLLANTTETRYDSTNFRPKKRPTVAVSHSQETPNHTPNSWPTIPSTPTSDVTLDKISDVEQRIEQKFSQQISGLKTYIEQLTTTDNKLPSPDTSHPNLEEKFATLQKDLETKMNDKINDISKKLQDQVVTNINVSFENLTKALESKLDGTMMNMIDNISQRISTNFHNTHNSQIPIASNDSQPFTQHSEVLLDGALSPASDVEMTGSRDP